MMRSVIFAISGRRSSVVRDGERPSSADRIRALARARVRVGDGGGPDRGGGTSLRGGVARIADVQRPPSSPAAQAKAPQGRAHLVKRRRSSSAFCRRSEERRVGKEGSAAGARW